MIEISSIITIIIGGIIGYITNDIAIRMLFRPHKAKHIFGIKIPFTPGLIPKEKARIADSIGNAISENLMSKDVLEKYLLSDEMVGKIRSAIEGFINTQRNNQETVEAFLRHYISEVEMNAITSNVNQSLTTQISNSLLNPAVGEKVAHVAIEHISGTLVGGILSPFGGMIREPAERFLAQQINSILQRNGEQIVSNMVGQEVDMFLDKQVCKLLEGRDEQLSQVVNTVVNLYCRVIKEHLPKILESVDISKIVRDRINEMDVMETEKLILKVMNKELKAIVWLGALLGLLMGSINLII